MDSAHACTGWSYSQMLTWIVSPSSSQLKRPLSDGLLNLDRRMTLGPLFLEKKSVESMLLLKLATMFPLGNNQFPCAMPPASKLLQQLVALVRQSRRLSGLSLLPMSSTSTKPSSSMGVPPRDKKRPAGFIIINLTPI